MKIFNRFWCWVVLRQLRQKFHHFCTIFKDSCTLCLCNIISRNSEIEKYDQGKQTIAPSLHRMGSLKEYERFMLWKITIDWWKRCVCWLSSEELQGAKGRLQSNSDRRSSCEAAPPRPASDPAPEDGGVASSPGPSRNESRSLGSMLFNCKIIH